jgi:tol-pal system protein YbgF
MKKPSIPVLLALLALSTCLAQPAAAQNTKSQLIQIQTQLQIMQDSMTKMQQSFDERMGVMKEMVTAQTDNVNKMGVAVQNLQKTLGSQTSDASTKVDQISGQIQALHDSVDELKARMAKLSKQLDDIQAGQHSIQAPATGAPGAGAAQAPPADQLYNDALRDYTTGKNDLAGQEFAQYLQFYGNTDLAGNAQFYLGEIQYRQGNLAGAVQSYNKVLDQYPGGNKSAAAQLKKGYALLDLGQKTEGIAELRSLISRYPKSPEAVQAKDRLGKLGVAGAASKPARPSPRSR